MGGHADLAVAKEILLQLGGRKFLAVTGCKDLVGDETSLRMHLPKNKSQANYLMITLGGDDLYVMRFFYYRAGRYKIFHEQKKVVEIPTVEKEIQRFEGVYCDRFLRYSLAKQWPQNRKHSLSVAGCRGKAGCSR